MSSSTSRSRGVSCSSGSLLATAAEELGHDRGIEGGSAFCDAAHCRRELVDIGDPILEEVAEPLGRVREQIHRVRGLDVLREDEYARARVALPYLGGRAKPLVRVRRGHPDVDDRDGRRVHRHVPQKVVRATRLRDDVEARIREEARDALAEEHGVVGENDGDPRAEHRDRVSQRREVARQVVGEQLVNPLRTGEPFEPVLAEISARQPVQGREHLVRDEDLPAVSGVRDPRRANDVDSRVALVVERRRPDVEPDPDAHGRIARPAGIPERALRRDRRLSRRRADRRRPRRTRRPPHRPRLRRGRDGTAQQLSQQYH